MTKNIIFITVTIVIVIIIIIIIINNTIGNKIICIIIITFIIIGIVQVTKNTLPLQLRDFSIHLCLTC